MPEPTRTRKALGRELATLRRAAELAQKDMYPGEEQRTAQSKASRTEKGLRVPGRAELAEWFRLTGAPDEARAQVLDLLDRVNRGVEPWDEEDGRHLQWMAAEREEASRLIRNYSTFWIPGLLQTWDYARMVIPQTDTYRSIDHASAVQARMDRQLILSRDGRQFEFVVAESALAWAPGDDVMAAQRVRLLQAFDNRSIELRVLPSARVGAVDWGNFIIYTPQDESDPVTVALEYPHGGGDTSDVKAVGVFEAIWAGYWSAALAGDEAVEFIRGIGGGGH